MKKKVHMKNLKRFYIFFIIISTIYILNLSTSRYVAQMSSNDSVLAIPVLNLSNENAKYEITDMLPGQTREYTFSVSNSEGEKLNELMLSYYFQINLETTIPLTIKLYDITEEEQEMVITEGKTQNITMEREKSITKNYKLQIIWDAKDNSYEYANKKIVCSVTLEATQV